MSKNLKLTREEAGIKTRGISFLDTLGFSLLVGAFAIPLMAALSGHFEKSMMNLLVPEIFMFAIGFTWLVSYILKPMTEPWSWTKG